MTEINVIQRTQKIIVDPATRSVQVISAGAPGPAGAQGLAGPTGPTGPPGPVGATGPSGNDINIRGSDTYANIIAIPDPAVGDMWLQTDDGGGGNPGDALIWDGFTWSNVGPVRGPEGPEGPAGADGSDGSDGVDGAEGPEGPAGPQGEDGPTGPTGPTGATGDAGVWIGSQAEYDALGSYDPDVLYAIVG